MAENRIDPTVPGLFLVAVIALVFGFFGVDLYLAPLTGKWGLVAVAGPLAAAIGIVFVVLTVSAIRAGNAFAAALFAFVAIALYAVQMGFNFTGGSPFMFYLIAVVFIVFVLVAFIVGAPKMLAIMLLFVALLYLFVGVFVNDSSEGIYALVFGVFGILAGVIALYLSFALSTQKLPVF